MGVINAAALAILGFLLLRKLVSMERYFEVRVFLITAFLCGLLLFFFVSLVTTDGPGCATRLPGEAEVKVVFCAEY